MVSVPAAARSGNVQGRGTQALTVASSRSADGGLVKLWAAEFVTPISRLMS